MTESTSGSVRAWRAGLLAGALVLGLACPAAQADEVKLGQFWIKDITVQSFTDGKVVYLTSTGSEVVQPLEKLEGVKVDAYPAVGKAEDLLAAGDLAGARAAFNSAIPDVREAWLKVWIDAQLVRVNDRMGEPVPATEAFLRLVQANADASFVGKPPVKSLQEANDAKKKDIRARIEPLLTTIRNDAAKESLQVMLALVGATNAAGAEAVARAQDIQPQDLPGQPAIPLPSVMMRETSDPVTRLLWLGKFSDAMVEADKELSGDTRRLSLRLFQRGLAQLALADAAKTDQKLYKDAGLSFMRVVIHFPSRHDLVGPSLVEAAYVHQKIGRPDIASELFKQAALMVDAESEPAYAARMEKLMAGQ